MTAYRVQVTLHTVSGVAQDYVTNTWHVLGTSVSDAEDFTDTLRAGYNTLATRFGSTIAQNGHTIKVYNMEDPEPRAPVLEYSWNLTSAPAANALPTEVALCMSFQAEKISGVPQARRRNRIYFGPFGNTINGNDGRPTTVIIGLLTDFGTAILDASAGATWDWGIFSTFNPGGLVEVSNGWVDNEWDTQRRRGREATSRVVFTPT